MVTTDAAIEEMTDVFRVAWLAGPISPVPPIAYRGVELDPPDDASWCRLSIQHTDGDQETLAAAGGREFQDNGFVFVQIFVPKGSGADQILAQLIDVAKGAFRGVTTTSGVVFWEVGHRDLSDEPQYIRANVSAQFWYRTTA